MQLFENTHKQATSNSERAVAMIVRFRRYLFIHICMHSEASGEHWAVRWECHELLLLFGTYFSNLKIRLHTEFIYIFLFFGMLKRGWMMMMGWKEWEDTVKRATSKSFTMLIFFIYHFILDIAVVNMEIFPSHSLP